jgi:hypothetical protein
MLLEAKQYKNNMHSIQTVISYSRTLARAFNVFVCGSILSSLG